MHFYGNPVRSGTAIAHTKRPRAFSVYRRVILHSLAASTLSLNIESDAFSISLIMSKFYGGNKLLLKLVGISDSNFTFVFPKMLLEDDTIAEGGIRVILPFE